MVLVEELKVVCFISGHICVLFLFFLSSAPLHTASFTPSLTISQKAALFKYVSTNSKTGTKKLLDGFNLSYCPGRWSSLYGSYKILPIHLCPTIFVCM